MNGFQVELTGFQVTKYFYYTQARKMLGDSCSIPRAESDHQNHDITISQMIHVITFNTPIR